MAKTSILLRNNSTLAPVVTVYDLYDAKIYEQINDKYTFDFNILPYENVWQIGYPNIVEVNNDYFQIRRVTKYRTNTLAMSISCEHISYELNAPYEIAMTNEEEWPDFVYEATPTVILTEMLGGTRFNVGSVMFTGSVKFVSSAMGMRSMIIEFAKSIGAEVKFEKFTVSLLARRGVDNGLLLNVG